MGNDMALWRPCMRILCAILVSLQLTTTVSALKGDSACKYSLCVTATVEDEAATYELTTNTEPMGWVAVGFGAHMTNTPMVVMWKNDDGTTTLSQRYTTGYNEPQVVSDPPRIATVVSVDQSLHPAGTSTLAFKVPTNSSFLASVNPVEPLIFAYSLQRPDKDPASHIARHQRVGHFKLDFSKDFVRVDAVSTNTNTNTGLSTSTSTQAAASTTTPHSTVYQGSNMAYKRVEKLIILHGFLVSLGFLVLLPAGSLIGRWGRAFTPKWFRAHWLANMAVAGPVITLGVLLGPAIVYNKESFRIHFANAHEVYGGVLLLVYFAQVLLGRYIHARRVALAAEGPITRNHPPLNIAHIVLGVLIIALSFFQVRSGLEWWETLTGRGPIASWAEPLWRAWIVILPLAYFGGYALLPRQLRQEQAAAYVPILEGDVSEAVAQTSHLLADEDRA